MQDDIIEEALGSLPQDFMRMSGVRYAASLPTGRHEEVHQWCVEQFGQPSLTNGRWFSLSYTIQFRDAGDRNWYMLRWS
jgi:hypothetical protein